MRRAAPGPPLTAPRTREAKLRAVAASPGLGGHVRRQPHVSGQAPILLLRHPHSERATVKARSSRISYRSDARGYVQRHRTISGAEASQRRVDGSPKTTALLIYRRRKDRVLGAG